MKKLILLLCLCGIQSLWSQEKYTLNSSNSFVSYKAKHFLHAWEGTNNNVKGLLTKKGAGFNQMALVMTVTDFNSKNSSRDANASEVLEVLSFPKITFTASEISQENDSLNISGTLSFHGVEISKTIAAKLEEQDNELSLSGTFKLNLTEFDIKLPSFMLKKMEENIQVSYLFKFRAL
ncbi:MAG: YceI family protein [Flavobacteriia bacterium]|nr:YceI family protein [Flavobacteriia bacterium]